MPKPKLFIGSSLRWIAIARAIKQQLRDDIIAEVWDEGVFHPNNSPLEDLMVAVDAYDFAAFVFGPDDLRTIRKEKKYTVRDNVLFELGLFTGRLGRSRTMWIVPNGSDIYIPTDLFGINYLKFDPKMDNQAAAAGYVCNEIRMVIGKHGLRAIQMGKGIDEISRPKVFCGATEQWEQFGLEQDSKVLKELFEGTTVCRNLKCKEFSKALTEQPWDILHLLGHVDPHTGDFICSTMNRLTKKADLETRKVSAQGLIKLIELAKVRLVVLASAEALVLAAHLAKITNVITAVSPVQIKETGWTSLFYGLLAKGQPLSLAFDVANAASNVSLVLFARKEFCIAPKEFL